MPFLVIDEKKCQRDGICVAVCPHRILELKTGALTPTPIVGVEHWCIRCRHCVAVCPHDALSIESVTPEDCPLVRKDLALTEEHVEHFLRARRSIRTFREKKVEHDSLAKLIDVARYGPTGSNTQNVAWLVIDSREEVKKLAGMIVDMLRMMIRQKHPLPDTFRVEEYVKVWESGVDVITRGAPALALTHTPREYPMGQVDSSIALTFLDLAAPSFGLGTCWGGFFMLGMNNWAPLQEAIALPDDRVCNGAMLVGYPKYAYRRLPPRNPPVIEWR